MGSHSRNRALLLAAAALSVTACVPADPRSAASLRMAERLAALKPADDADAVTVVTRDFLGNRPERIPARPRWRSRAR